jgi:hypothetical protein
MQVLIEKALVLINEKRYIDAFNTLQPIATSSNPHICLYAADLLHKVDKQGAYDYLLDKWKHGQSGALHRLVLLKHFFNSDEKLTHDDIGLLEQESSKGNLETSLVLYMLYEDDIRRNVYCQRIKFLSEDLSNTLEITESTQKILIDDQTLLGRLNNEPSVYKTNLLSESINLKVFRNVFSDMLCNYVKLRTEGLLAPAMIVNPLTGKGEKHPIRYSLFAQVVPELLDWFFLVVDRKLEQLSGIDKQCGEPLAVLKYGKSQEYKPHYDAFVETELQKDDTYLEGGQRTKTLICGLSAAKEGGETAFPKLNIKIKLQPGDVLMFDNVGNDKKILLSSYHAGLPVSSGDKWVMTKWTREKPTNYGKIVYSN